MSRITYLKFLSIAAFFTLISGGFIVQILKPDPCILCGFQRDIWLLIFLWSFFAWFKVFHRRFSLFFYASFFSVLASFLVAGFHTGIEYHIWELPESFCSATALKESVFLNEDLNNLTLPSCKIPFYLFPGISLALINMLSSLFFLILGMGAYLRRDK